ncbi:MAG: pitrilysin family protein, partial [Chloroflexi bacterium]|nr:pitrilysin family protein [Chloroflexota bacterium]
VGGIMNGGTDREITSYWCKLASQHFEIAVDVIVDLLRNPLFRAEDVDKERQVIIEEINMSLDSPQQRVGMIFDELMWPGKAMGRDVAGSKETVGAITREQMLYILNNYYTPNNMLVSIAGNFETDSAIELLRQATGDWQKGMAPEYRESKVEQAGPRTVIEHRETEQVNLVMGVEAPSVFHPDRFAVYLLNIILGVGMSCRLFTEIREKLGLAYDVHSYIETFRETGVFGIMAGIEPGNTGKAIKAILKQLAKARDGVSEAELNKAREMSMGGLLLSMEDSRKVAGWYGAQEVLTGKIMTIDDVKQAIENVTLEDIRRVAGELFKAEKLNLAIVGPVKDDGSVAKLMKL